MVYRPDQHMRSRPAHAATVFLFILIVAPVLLISLSVYVLWVPTTYTRVFPGSSVPQSYTELNISTAILLLTAAIGLGPICIFCSTVGSPRKGRYALAYAMYLACFIVQNVGFYLDRANVQYCRFNSLETSNACIHQSCVSA